MSYSVNVRVHLGEATVTATGDVPDGEFTVTGHEDDSRRMLSVARRDADGRYAQQAGSVHYKES